MRSAFPAPGFSNVSNSPTGLAFEIDDLVFVQDWAERNDIRFAVRLDHGFKGEEYEEVIVLYTNACQYSRLIIWRNEKSVFVQPLIGRRLAYASVVEALESLPVKEAVVLTDITATAWPADWRHPEYSDIQQASRCLKPWLNEGKIWPGQA